MEGWIGGGCVQTAVRRAALLHAGDRRGAADPRGADRGLAAQGLAPGAAAQAAWSIIPATARRGARSTCSSSRSCPRHAWSCWARARWPGALGATRPAPRATACARTVADGERGFIVVATQGRGDLAALRAALASPAEFVAFVGSRRKTAALRDALAKEGVPAERLAALRAPAGLAIGAIGPEEIALSILAEDRSRPDAVSSRGASAADAG